MRVAIVYDCLFPHSTGGGERVYRRMAELLAERGAQVTYITRHSEGAMPSDFVVAEVWRGDIYDAHGNRTISSALRFGWGVWRHMVSRRGAYDMVVTSTLPSLTAIAVALALVGSRVFVVSDWLEIWTGTKWRSYSGAVAGSIAFALQWCAARVGHLQTANSEFTQAKLQRINHGTPTIVLGLVDLVTTAVVPSVGMPERPAVLFVGRFIPDKHADAVPAAVMRASEREPGLHAVLVGHGPERLSVEAAIESAGAGHRVHLAGRVDDETLAELFATATVLVNPTSREGFGLVVAEAASHAVPTVLVEGADNAAIDLIEEGINGFVVPSRSPEDLAAGIIAVMSGGEALRVSTREWFDRASADRSLARSVDQILSSYRADPRST